MWQQKLAAAQAMLVRDPNNQTLKDLVAALQTIVDSQPQQVAQVSAAQEIKDLAISAVVTGPVGFEHGQTFYWKNLKGATQFFANALNESAGVAATLAKQHPGDLTTVFNATINGAAQHPVVVAKHSEKALNKYLRHFMKKQDELIAISEHKGGK